MRLRKKKQLFLSVVAFMLFASACGGTTAGEGTSDTNEDGTENSSESSGNASGEVVKVGALFPLTGSVASAGQQTLNGVMLAEEIVNGEFPELADLPLAETAGLPNVGNAQVEVISTDHKGEADVGQAEAERLIESEEVVALTGAFNSSVTKTASEKAERLGIPFVNGSSSSTALTEDPERAELEYFFRTGPSDKTFAESFFKFLEDLEEEGEDVRDVALLYENTEFGNEAARVTKELAEEFDFNIVADVPHGNDVSDITPEAQKIITADPDIIFQASQTSEAILFMNAWENNEYAAPILAYGAGFSDPQFFESVGTKADFVVARAAWSLDAVSAKPAAVNVAEMYEERFDQPMDENSARTFTAAMTLFAAIDAAGSSEPDAIRDALTTLNLSDNEIIMPWEGILFAENGQNELAQGIVTQRLEEQYAVVWPFETAPTELTWPVPPVSQR